MLYNGNIQRARSLSVFVHQMKAVFVCFFIGRLFVGVNEPAELIPDLFGISELLISFTILDKHPALPESKMLFTEERRQIQICFLRETHWDIHVVQPACSFKF